MEILISIVLLVLLSFVLYFKKNTKKRNVKNVHDRRKVFYKANSDVIIGVEWLATLDFRTCLVCGVLDGTRYKVKGKKPKVPAHENCRCLYLPVTELSDCIEAKRPAEMLPTAFLAEQRYNSENHKKRFDELASSTQRKYFYTEQKILAEQGIEVYKRVNWNYRQWFAKLPEKYQRIILGDERFEIMVKHNLKLEDFVNIEEMREYTLTELYQKWH